MRHDHETIWNSVFGPDATPAGVLRDAADNHATPQDYTIACIIEAEKQGFDCERTTAYGDLCRQLGIDPLMR